MKNKLLYIGGGILGLFVIIGIFALTPEKSAVQNKTQDTPVVIEQSAPIVEENKTQTPNKYYAVSKVVDGDTVSINIDGKSETFRLIGIDTSETVDPRKIVQCFGIKASNKAKELLSGKTVRIEYDESQGRLDKYNRVLGYVFLTDGTNFNKYMIEQGYAYEYTYNLPYKYQAEFKKAQLDAENNKRGLWAPGVCEPTPTSTPTSTQVSPTTTPTPTLPTPSGVWTPTPTPSVVGATPTLTPTPTSSPTLSPTPNPTTTPDPSPTQLNYQFYTSSYYTAKYYYPASCNGWESLSPKYLKGFNTLDDLLKAYPSRTASPSC